MPNSTKLIYFFYTHSRKVHIDLTELCTYCLKEKSKFVMQIRDTVLKVQMHACSALTSQRPYQSLFNTVRCVSMHGNVQFHSSNIDWSSDISVCTL